MSNIRLAWLATHPIQYQSPLLREIAKTPGIDLTAVFFSDFSTRNYVDEEFGHELEWDTPLLDGFNHIFLEGDGASVNSVSFLSPRIKQLDKVLNRDNFDAVLIQGWNHYGYVLAALRAKKEGLKVLLRCEATDHVEGSTGLKGFVRQLLVKLLLSRVDKFLAIGTRNRQFYESRGIPEEKIGSMPYCVDNDYFRRLAENSNKEEIRRELKLEKGRPVILYASKLTTRKYADLLLSAYGKMKGSRPYLLVVGDGELMPRLKEMTEEMELSDVRFLGFRNQSELPAYYSLADVFVLPSVNETWGLVVNEAMNAGCAIIVTDQVGSGSDLVRDGINGFVIPPADEDALVGALESCMKEDKYIEMGRQSMEIIRTWGIPENIAGLKSGLV
ncbi:MAG: glycosyltransferase family 4 protein [Sedimenticola sp.]